MQYCTSHFISRSSFNNFNENEDNSLDFNGIDATNPREIDFFSNVWKNISECDAQIHVPAKEKPC